jgi:DNA-binding IclR family transcriptional regulator
MSTPGPAGTAKRRRPGSAPPAQRAAKPLPVQSIARAFRILEAIADRPEGISHADLSKAVGLHASTAFHLIRTMLALDYLRQDPETKRYHIARRVFLLAARVSDEVNLVNAGLPVMRELAESLGETAHLGVLSRDGAITIAKSEGASTFRVSERLGVLRPAHCTAIGKALLASLPKGELDDFLARAELKAFTPRTIVDPARLRRELDRVRDAGYAVDDAEFNGELRCAAALVRDFSGRGIAALGVSGPAWRVKPEELARIGKRVVAAADRLSAELGFRERVPMRAVK